ncbi:CPBP family intramembrane metalloprotease [Polaribacter sp. WD7]|uniref:CPBP family intramembrane glutamic endopeptidase n=1 Tax=Polaribacter sp. WD7 TaxID=2269061 RepID=UPI000DF38958|nr:type II CAAX endopeptidase family protein [Polaribacter sp. WD7]RCS26062.1 CPBP family intramembrane metalloprotease [Polaribacter sp. WD7]
MNTVLTDNYKKKYQFLEILLLFVVTPIVLTLPILIGFKITYLLLGVLYIVWISITKKSVKKEKTITLKRLLLLIVGRFFIIAISTAAFIFFKDKSSLFSVMLNKPMLWIKFSGIYIVFSVIPQELIYRSFFVKRYRNFIKNKKVFIILNSILFSFAHIWFQSWVVLIFTFIGSLFFIDTYLKTRSIWLVILEHSLYGVWLYTVGYGALFMFPV